MFKNKILCMKAVRAVTDMGLAQAKYLVELLEGIENGRVNDADVAKLTAALRPQPPVFDEGTPMHKVYHAFKKQS